MTLCDSFSIGNSNTGASRARLESLATFQWEVESISAAWNQDLVFPIDHGGVDAAYPPSLDTEGNGAPSCVSPLTLALCSGRRAGHVGTGVWEGTV